MKSGFMVMMQKQIMKIQAISQAVLESIKVSSRDASSIGRGAEPGIGTLKGTTFDWTIRLCYIVPVWNLVDYTSYVYVHISWTECMIKQGSFLFLHDEAFSVIFLVQKKRSRSKYYILVFTTKLILKFHQKCKKEIWILINKNTT